MPLTATIKGREVTIPNADRQPCEIWTRVMGYYRRVEDMNIGKRAEHRDRTLYSEQKLMGHY